MGRRLVNLTKGFRFAPPFLSLDISPSDPNVIYVGTARGYIHISKDGGASWSEARVLVPPGNFYGSIRPTGAARVGGMSEPGGPKAPRTSDALGFYASPGDPLNDFVRSRGPIRGAYDTALAPPAESGSRGGGGGGARLGVGLRAGSAYLSLALRRKRGWAIGINIKQTLALKSKPPISVNWISVNPENPNDALAATHSGLLRTTDGGVSWPIVVTGASEKERQFFHVVRSPHDPKVVYVASGVGLLKSEDSGNSFTRVADSRLAQMAILWTTLHPTDPNRIYVGTFDGMFMSLDGGKNYDWVFVRPWPAQNRIYRIAVDPSDPNRVLMGTGDGLFVTEDGGKKFERGGGLQFTGYGVGALSSSGAPGHFIAADGRDIWETRDGGKTWTVVYFGATYWDVRNAFFSRHHSGDIWLVTSAEVMRLTTTPAARVDPEVYVRFKRYAEREPSVQQAVYVALQRAGIERSALTALRARTPWKGFLPKIEAGVRWRDTEADIDGHRPFDVGDLDGGRRFQNDAFDRRFIFSVVGKWDLRELIFSRDEAPMGRVFGTNRHAEWWFRNTIINLFLERQRLLFESMANPDDEPRRALMRDLRLEELTAHLNALTGDLFRRIEAL